MKHLKIIITGFSVVAVSYLQLSCSKQAVENISGTETDFSNKATVQVYVAAVNASRNYLYIDGKTVTGNLLATGSIFPTTGIGIAVNGGVKTFLLKDTLPATTQVPFTFPQNFEASKHYTVFVYDTITSLKQKTVVDNIVIPTDTTARVRFANFIYSTSAIPAVDVFSLVRNQTIFTNVAVTDVTDFVSYPSRAPVDTLYIRETGTTNVLAKIGISVLTPKRNYTLVYRGSQKVGKVASFYGTY
jgi:hypothetical protein